MYLLLGLKQSQQLLETLQLVVRIDVHIPVDTVRNVVEEIIMKHKCLNCFNWAGWMARESKLYFTFHTLDDGESMCGRDLDWN